MEENQRFLLPRPLPHFFDIRGSRSNYRPKMSNNQATTSSVSLGDYPFSIAQPEGTPSDSTPLLVGNHPTNVTVTPVTPPSASELGGVEPAADITVPCGLTIAASQPQNIETFRAQLFFCTLLDENPTFMLESFNTYARMRPGEAAAALVAMARGDGETRQGMTTLLENLYRVDKSAAIDLFSLILRPQSSDSSLPVENFPTRICHQRSESAATYVGSHGVRRVVNLALTYFVPLQVRRWVGI